jgi:hypothetical protein
MPTITNRLNAIEAAIGDARSRDREERGREFYRLIDDKELVLEDFERLMFEDLERFREDIAREAMWLRRSIDAGATPTIRGRVGELAAIVAIPPDIPVPEVIIKGPRARREYLSKSVWDYDDSWSVLAWWLQHAVWATVLGLDDGDELRRRFHGGEFADLGPDDPRNLDGYDKTDGWYEQPEFSAALTAAVTGRPAVPAQPVAPPVDDNPMRYIVAALAEPSDMTVTESPRPVDDPMRLIV